jgi:two-component system, NarL family, nitrate/nitrite response regulator NarL
MASIVSVVIHPSRIFREGLTSILANSPFMPACAAASTKDVPSTISSAGEQVLVLIGVREVSNLAEALTATKTSFPNAYVVVLGDATRRDNVTAALELGATSFVDENLATSSLVKELELVTLGEPVISVFILKQLLHHSEETMGTLAVDEPQPSDALGQAELGLPLSCREAAILNGLVKGASNKVIAYELRITEATVKVHVKAILRKIRVKNRTQAAIWALSCQAVPKTLALENGVGPQPNQPARLGSNQRQLTKSEMPYR